MSIKTFFGFTLNELLIVIAVLVFLAGIAVLNFWYVRKKY
jgi:prepilin-type N-terminal cleavage/methylation domain-containing protein